MAVEHAMFTFDDLKVTSHDDRMTDRMTTKVLSSRPRLKCGKTNKASKQIKSKRYSKFKYLVNPEAKKKRAREHSAMSYSRNPEPQ